METHFVALSVLLLGGCGAVAPEEAKPDSGSVDSGAADTAPIDTGPKLAAPREQTWAEVTREEKEPTRFRLLIEVWPKSDGTCAPPPDVSADYRIIGVMRWDGRAGVFPLGLDTPGGRAMFGVGTESAKGTFTIEPYTDKPRFVSYDTDLAGKGILDISRCGNFDAL